MKKENENVDIEVVIGDDTNLNFSNVEDCVNTLRPKDKTLNKNNLIIPKDKKNKNPKNDEK